MDLNPAQRQAAEAGEGPVLIVAGPGTGKTKTLAARIVYLVQSELARPEQILALTFTKKAAEEMRVRVQAALAAKTAAHISTFHALCSELLDGDAAFVSELARLQVIKKLTRPDRLKRLSAREVGLLISRAKNMAEDDPELARLVAAYDAALSAQGLIDFDDLLVKTRQLLASNAEKRAAVQARYRYILVDEFQDTNKLQYELLNLIRGHSNVFVIGDPAQSIYGFRGASGDIFGQFEADFPDRTRIELTINYRSVPEVVKASNAIFTNRPALTAHAHATGRIRAVQVLNEYAEAAWVNSEIQRAIGGGDLSRAVSDDDAAAHLTFRDFAILYRGRKAALATQRAIADSGLPYQIVGDGSPYDHPEVQALIALMRCSLTGELPELEGYSASAVALLRDKLLDAGPSNPSKLAEMLIELLGLESSPSLRQFVNGLVRFRDVAAAVAHFDSMQSQNYYDDAADVITLSTIHASKGLEFAHVFLIGAEQGILPHDKADTEEEKRLFYVAVTRAKTNLDIIHVKHRGGQPAQLTCFVQELPDDVIPKIVDPHLAEDQRRLQKRQAKKSQRSLF
ncbi:MAG TPA: ATP-dependent helicase [Bacillota bacterium]|nr:ATP-dependent helicase [Bacillota bacterium]